MHRLILTILSFVLSASIALAQTPLPHKPGQLVNDNGTIYLIQKTERLGFRSPAEFFSYGYTFDMALPANEEDRKLPPRAVKARSGTLALDAADNKTYYLVFDTGARKIETDTLLLLGLENYPYFKINLSDYEITKPFDLLESFKAGPPGTLIKDGKTIYLITAEGRGPFPSADIFKSYGYRFGMARAINSEEDKLPVLAPLAFRDGTLVNDKGTIFLISENKKYGFRTWEGFVSPGYKIKTVIKGSTAGIPEGESLD